MRFFSLVVRFLVIALPPLTAGFIVIDGSAPTHASVESGNGQYDNDKRDGSDYYIRHAVQLHMISYRAFHPADAFRSAPVSRRSGTYPASSSCRMILVFDGTVQSLGPIALSLTTPCRSITYVSGNLNVP